MHGRGVGDGRVDEIKYRVGGISMDAFPISRYFPRFLAIPVHFRSPRERIGESFNAPALCEEGVVLMGDRVRNSGFRMRKSNSKPESTEGWGTLDFDFRNGKIQNPESDLIK